MTGNLRVRADRIADDIDALSEITDPDRPWTRRAFTPRFLEGRAWLEEAMRRAGLEPRIDAAGNMIGRRAGLQPGTGTLVVGSHTDTVPEGGRFDGIAGVIAGLEIARALRDRGIALAHDLEVIDCLAEEVSIFGVSCIGSRGIAGVLPDAWMDRTSDGLTLREGIAGVGGDPERLSAARRTDIVGYLELHIEQGPVLEREGVEIGAVTAIAGIARIEIIVEGRADHAGTTPMDGRADALVAASALVGDVAERASALAAAGNGHFAATVGEFRIEPNAANVVPSHARLLVDIRSERRQDLEAFAAALADTAERVAARTGTRIADFRRVSDNPAVRSDPGVLAAIEAAADRVGVSHRRMASGAGHDMAFFARIAPSAMVFVPCRDGRSHTPEEWADADAIALGTEVLLETLLALDGQTTGR